MSDAGDTAVQSRLSTLRRRAAHTKIVATVGPACADPDPAGHGAVPSVEKLIALIRAGADVFRINTAHGGRNDHQGFLDAVRRAERQVGFPVAVLVDLPGPKIRLGDVPGGELQCQLDDTVRFVRGPGPGGPGELTTTYDALIDDLTVGDRVLLADGMVVLRVEQLGAEAARCRVVQAGAVRSRQGVHLPGVKLKAPALGDGDREHARWAARAGADFVGLSFTRTAADVRAVKELLAAEGAEARVVAKIEKPEALENLQDIVEAADAVMVARGDLGVEIDIARMPAAQKRVIAVARTFRKPVIIATQMLESMQHARLPTRAEVTDVANAILDGADACMLSAETAVGTYPRDAVAMMSRIAAEAEKLARQIVAGSPDGGGTRDGGETAARVWPWEPVVPDAPDIPPITQHTAYAAGKLAQSLGARLIVVATASGATARCISKNRPFVETIGVSDSLSTLRHLCLYWGVTPLGGTPPGEPDRLLEKVLEVARREGVCKPPDRVVLIAGTGLSVSRHNMIVVHQLD